jgi:hypothetical protein
MDVLLSAATMNSEQTLAATVPNTAVASATASVETASSTCSKRAAIGGRETKTKVPKKSMSKEEKGVDIAKRRVGAGI